MTAATTSGSTAVLMLDRPLVGLANVTYGWSVDPAALWVKGPRGNAVACFAAVAVP